ncbi:MAG: Hsp70 family protein [Phycisphaerales bacterium]|nr:MAG: Hsp70 family protein [Phycisphaerales bacterium]
MKNIIGIDYGTHTTIAAKHDDAGTPVVISNQNGEQATLSNVYIDRDGSPLFGSEAFHLGIADPARYVQDAKRSVGSDAPVLTVDQKSFTAEDVMSLVLQEIKRSTESSLGDTVDDVVISRPANWTAAQKEELLQAARAAGLNAILLPPEPTAALFGMGVQKQGDGIVVAIDVGGGTTDVSIAEVDGNSVAIRMTNGIAELGGRDFNAVLLEWAMERFEQQFGRQPDANQDAVFIQDLVQKIEHGKRMLSKKNETRIVLPYENALFDVTASRDQYQAMTAPLVERVMDCTKKTLDDAGINTADVRAFFLIGAQTLDPAFSEALEKHFDRKPWAKSDPIFAAAKGNVLLGQLELEKDGYQVRSGTRVLPPLEMSARDITTHPIGVAALDEDKRLVQSVIIPKGTAIPSKRVERFKLAEPGQTGAHVQLLEGTDGAPRGDCQPLGHFDLDGAEAVHDRDHIIEVEFRLDKNAMLTASARDPINGATAEMTIDYRNQQANGAA